MTTSSPPTAPLPLDVLGRHDHHGLPVHEVVLLLETHEKDGLSHQEAAARLERFGPNVLPRIGQRGPLLRFLLQFHHPLIYVLLGAAGVTLLLGDTVDCAVILGVVLVNAVVGFVQESRAGQALEALIALTRTQATVVRDGAPHRIDSAAVVPGDVVALQAGDKVPADLRLTTVQELRIDESSLTGESVAVSKHSLPLPVEVGLGDRLNMAFSSTLVTGGQGRGVVVATGADTEIGRIHRLVGESAGVSTPLTRKLAVFSKWLTVAILALAAVTFALGLLRGESASYMVTAAVALAVGAIPEGLPAAVTITLAIGMGRMARRHAIIRKLPATETLGSTTIICTDKTGTLTQNRMTVRTIVAGGQAFDVSGNGLAARGPASQQPPAVLQDHPALVACLEAGVLCNDAQASRRGDGWHPTGDPTEAALLICAATAGIDIQALLSNYPRVDALPFESERRYMATWHRATQADGAMVAVKGGVERVLDLCADQLGTDAQPQPLDRAGVLAAAEELSGQALRVLAFARAMLPPGAQAAELTEESLSRTGLTFLGLQAMDDPPRPEAVAAVHSCHTAGIHVKMITGDHAATARAIAGQVGLTGVDGGPPAVMTGGELAACPDEALPEVLQHTAVFARVSAEQKLRIVEGLQAGHHVVAMTGDGVNDAPALKQADIGIAMGKAGTDVAKESADMVLTDDNFATIEAAVEEGRGVFDNLTKFITWTLPTNLAEGLVILTAIVLAADLPILPVQILWINMTTAVALGLMLAFEPAEPGLMQRPPRDPQKPVLTRTLVGRIILVSAIMLVGAFGLFEWHQAAGTSLTVSRTLAVNAFVAIEIGYLFNCRSLERPVRQLGWFSNPAVVYGVATMIVLQLLFTYLPAMNTLFQTAPISVHQWLAVVTLGIAGSGIVGVEKWWRHRRHSAG